MQERAWGLVLSVESPRHLTLPVETACRSTWEAWHHNRAKVGLAVKAEFLT